MGATTKYADNYKQGPAYSASQVGLTVTREFEFTVTAAFVTGDVLKMAPIPAGVILTDFFVDIPDLDSGAGLLLDYGDNTTADKYIANSTVGQSAGKVNGMVTAVAASLPAKYAAANSFNIVVDTQQAGGGGSGTIKGWIQYHYYGNTSL